MSPTTIISVCAFIATSFAVDANAQNTLKSTTTSIFTAIYEIIGVLGAIALLIMAINFKFHFIQNISRTVLATPAHAMSIINVGIKIFVFI